MLNRVKRTVVAGVEDGSRLTPRTGLFERVINGHHPVKSKTVEGGWDCSKCGKSVGELPDFLRVPAH